MILMIKLQIIFKPQKNDMFGWDKTFFKGKILWNISTPKSSSMDWEKNNCETHQTKQKSRKSVEKLANIKINCQ